jgi:putative nucleotidyltransferase with HDIG domain
MGFYLDLKGIQDKIGELPFLPVVLSELLQLNKDDEHYFEKVVLLARKDPSISTLILKMANSAATHSSANIDSLQMAMSRVGAYSIAGYVATLGVARVFVPVEDEHKMLWRHSIETAMIAEFLALRMGELHIDPGLAYLCGLLHDIGRLVMLDTVPNALAKTPSSSWSSAEELPKVEKATIGYDHSEVGLIACKHWQLPTVVCNVVRGHHMYSIFAKKELPEQIRNLILIIQFSDFISINLSKHPDWLDFASKHLEEKIKETCVHKRWGSVSLPIKDVSSELAPLIEKSYLMAQSIGCT